MKAKIQRILWIKINNNQYRYWFYNFDRFESLLRDNTVKQIEKTLKVEGLYFRLLPYVYALDLTDEWTNKVSAEGLPKWLESDFIGSREAMNYLKDVHIRMSYALENNSNTKKK